MRSTKKRDIKDARKERDKIMAPFLAQDEVTVLEHVAAHIEGRQGDVAAWKDSQNPPLAIEDAWAAYLVSPHRRDCGNRTLQDYDSYFRHFRLWLQEHHPHVKLMRDVTEAIAAEYTRSLIAEKLSAGSFNKHRDLLKGLFHTLRKQSKQIENPWTDIQRRKSVPQSRRELTVEELRKVCGSAQGELQVLFAIGIYTGLRLGDCATLRWAETDLHRRKITRIPNKTARRNPKPVIVPIHPVLLAMLAALPRDTNPEYVLPVAAGTYEDDSPALSRQIQEHFTACGIRTIKKGTGFETEAGKDGKPRRVSTGKRAAVEVGFHSLRHSFVSLCREANAPLAVVEAIVGHANPAMTRHYTHIGEAAAATAVAALPALGLSAGAVTADNPEAETITIPVAKLRELAEQLTPETAEAVRVQLIELAGLTHAK